MSGTEETEEAAGDAAVPVLTTGAGGLPAPTTGGGGLPSPVLTTAGETTAAGAGATPPGGGNILPADTESPQRHHQPTQHQQSQPRLSVDASQTKFSVLFTLSIINYQLFNILSFFCLQMID